MQNIAKFHVNFFFFLRNKLTTRHILTLEELTKTTNCLKNEFEIKDLDKTKFCLDLKGWIILQLYSDYVTYYKPGLKHQYYYFRACSNKYYCLLKKKNALVH